MKDFPSSWAMVLKILAYKGCVDKTESNERPFESVGTVGWKEGEFLGINPNRTIGFVHQTRECNFVKGISTICFAFSFSAR